MFSQKGMTRTLLSACALIVSVNAANRTNAIIKIDTIFQPQDYQLETGCMDGGTQSMKMTDMCHASSIAEPIPGTFLTIWYGGSGEGNSDQDIWMCKKVNTGDWSPPRQITQYCRRSVFNPVIFHPKQTPDAPVYIYARLGLSVGGFCFASDDAGETWYAPPNGTSWDMLPNEPEIDPYVKKLPAFPGGPVGNVSNFLGPIKAVPLEFPDGTVLFGSSTEPGGKDTWKWHVEIAEKGKYDGTDWQVGNAAIKGIQPTLIALSDDYQKIKAMVRDGNPGISNDGGKTWQQTTGQPNASGSAMAAVTCKNGWHACVHTPGRDRILISVSQDGSSWEQAVNVYEDGGRHSYPYMIEGSDGFLHLTWSWHEARGGGNPGSSAIAYAMIDPNLLVGLPATGTIKNISFDKSKSHIAFADNSARADIILNTPGKVTFKLLNAAGRIMAQVNHNKLSAGSHIVNLSHLILGRHGVFFIRALIDGKVSGTTKVLMQ